VAQLPSNLKLHDIAPDGRVLFTKEDSRARIYFVGPGSPTPVDLTWLNWAIYPVLSADGKTLLMTENDEATQGKDMIYLRGTDGSPAIRLGENVGVSMSPDGQWVATTRHPPARPDIALLPVHAGAPKPVDTGSLQLTGDSLPLVPAVTWLPDSQRILYSAKEPGQAPRTFIQEISGGQPNPVTPAGIWGSVLSPDGAFLLAHDGQSNARLFPLAGGKSRPLPFLTPEYRTLGFTADGQSLYVIKPVERPPKIWRMDVATGRTELWKEIPLSDPAVVVTVGLMQITPDGKSLAYSLRYGPSELYVAHGLR
jgi:Tol biopolymer transport system component